MANSDFTRALRNEQTQLAQRSLQLGRQSGNPDPLATVASSMPINAERLRNPEPTAQRIQDDFTAKDLAHLAQRSLSWMSDAPENPAMIKDELPEIIDWEKTIMRNLDSREAGNVSRGYENFKLLLGNTGAGLAFSETELQLDRSTTEMNNFTLAARAQAAGEELDYNSLDLPSGGHDRRNAINSVERFMTASPEERTRIMRELSVNVLSNEASASKYYAKLRELSAERQRVNFTAVQDLRDIRSAGDLLEWGVVQGLPSLGIMVGIMGAGLLTGGVGGVAVAVGAGTAVAQGEIVSGQVENIDSMVMYTPEERLRARQMALISGSLEAVLGPTGRVTALGTRNLFNAVTRREVLDKLSEPVLRRISQGYLRRIGAPFLRDGVEEFIAEGAQTLIEQYGVDGKLELNNETMWAALNGAVLGGITGGTIGMSVGARGAITNERTARAMADAGQTVQTMDQLAAVTQQLKLTTRSPSKFRALTDKLGLSNTSVFFQTDDIITHAQELRISPETLVERLGGSPEDFTAARDGNGRIAVKASGVVTSLAGDSAEFIKANASITAQGFTPTEAKSMTDIQAEIADQQALQNDLETMAPKRKSMLTQITSQLKATGRMTAPEVEANASLATAFFETMATRYGTSAEDMFQRMGFDITGEAQTLDDLATGQKELATQTAAVTKLQGMVAQLEAAVAAADPETKAEVEAQLQEAITQLEAAGVGIEELTAAVDAGVAQFQEGRAAQDPQAAGDGAQAADMTVLNQAPAGVDTSVAGGLTSKSFIRTRDLEGASIYPMFADLTAAGSTYDKLDGLPLAPTPYLGGPNFPWLKAYRDAGVVWAFNKVGVISKVRNKVRALREQSLAQGGDGRVVITMLAMKDDAHTSNEMTINALLRTLEGVIKAGQFPEGQLQKAHDLITSKSNKKDDGYAGLATLPMLDDAPALHDWIRQATFTTRKAMANEMNSAAFRSLEGMFPVGRVIREAVDPDYRATQQGDALLAMEIDPDADDLIIDFDDPAQAGDIPRHPAYRYGMRGTLVGSFSTHIPMEVLYKDLLEEVTSRSKEGSNPKFLMERLRTTDEQIVTPEIVRQAEVIEQLHDYRVAQAYTAGLAGQWRSSDDAANAGGINPAEFELALIENEAAATLTKYTKADIKAGKKDGSLRVFQLGDTRVQDGGLNVWMGVKKGLDYREEYPSDVTNKLVADGVLTDNETALVGVASNELGVQGMGTFQVLKAIEEGVTVLDAFKVKSESKPAGLLPSIYATMGFEEVGEILFDPQYFTAAEIEDLKAVWSRQGWREGDAFPAVAIMKWRGDDAIRPEATKRFVLEGQDGLGIRGDADFDQFDAEAQSVLEGDAAGNEGDGVTGQGDGRANPRSFADRARSVSGRARVFADNVMAADEAATKALKLPKSMIDAIRAQYGEPAAPQGQVLNQDKRGQIALPSNLMDARSVITLFQKSDKSTFVHEAGHFFLQAFKELAATTNAPADMIADMDTINDFLGRGAGDQSPFTVDQQEQWAQSFEKYMETGNAPSVELRTSFERLRKWIVNVYRQFGSLNVELPPEVTEVMDRMLATDDAIAIAKAEQGMGQMLTAKPANMTEEVWAAYRRGAVQHDDEAAATLLAKTMEPIRRARSKGYRERKAALRTEIEAAIDKSPEQRTVRRLTTKDQARLDRKQLLDTYGQEALDDLDKHTFKGRKVYGTSEASIEATAHQYGYKNAATMVAELRELPSRESRIENELRMRLREDFADALDDGSIKREAMAALHKDKNRQLMMMDLRFTVDMIAAEGGEVPTMMTKAELELRVEEEVSRTTVRTATQDAVYLHAERTAGRKAQTIMARIMKRMTSKGTPKTTASEDLVAAFTAKENQIIAHMKYNHAREAQKVVDRLVKANTSIRNKDVGKRLAEPQIGTLRQLMEKYSFRARSPKQLQQQRDLASYVKAMVEAGNEDQLSFDAESVIATGSVKHFSELTVEELQELDAIVKNLIHVGRATRKVLDGITKRAYQEVKTDIITELEAKHEDDGPSKTGKRDERLLPKGARAVRGFFLSMSNADNILRVLDQAKRDTVGLMGRVIALPVQDAMSRAGLRRRKNAEWFERDLWKGIYGKDYVKQLRAFTAMKIEATVGDTREVLDGYNLLTIALNTGADGNMERLTNPSSRNFMTKREIERVLKENMTADMWRVVDQVWGKINELWPDISDLEVQATGVRPQQIKTKIQVGVAPAFVKNGGYYPIRYDREQAIGTVRDSEADTQVKNMASGRASRAQTKSGWQKERTAVTGDPLSLQFHGALSHINDVVYDLELRLPLSGAMKVLKDKEISGVLTEKGFNQELEHLKLWAEDVANGDRQASDTVSRLVKQLREGTSVAAMAYSWTTLVQQPLGLFNAVNVIGAGNLIKGFSAYMGNVRQASDIVMSKSPFMQERQQTMQRDMALASGAMREDTLSGGRVGAFKQGLQSYGFVGMQKLQFYTVDMPTWYGAYGSAVERGQSDAEAVSYADRMVARAHGSGVMSDRSAFERGTVGANTRNSELVRAFTTFQTFIIARLSVTSVEFRNLRMSDPSTFMDLVSDLTIAYIMPSIFASLLLLRPWDEREKDDIEERGLPLWWLTTQLPSEFIGGPIISQALSSWEGYGAETSFESGIGAVVGAAKAVTQLAQGEGSFDSSITSLISGAGIIFKLPSVVINRAIKRVLDEDGLTGEELNLLEVLYGKELTFAD